MAQQKSNDYVWSSQSLDSNPIEMPWYDPRQTPVVTLHPSKFLPDKIVSTDLKD